MFGGVYIRTDEMIPVDGTVTHYAFFTGGNQAVPWSVTPLLLAKQAEGRFVISGIGESVSVMPGTIHRVRFRLVDGSAEVKAGQHVLGHYDGGVIRGGLHGAHAVTRNPGVVDLLWGGPWRYSWHPEQIPNIHVGAVFVVGGKSDSKDDGSPERPYRLGADCRTYAENMTVQPNKP